MKPADSPPPGNVAEEVAALIESLHDSQQRLEVLTKGEIDSVADRDGRTFLLRRAQEQLRISETAKQAAILNALPAHIALIDPQGVIVSSNETWRSAAPHALHGPAHAIGTNYLETCENGWEDEAIEAGQIAKGIRAVLDGLALTFAAEYSTRYQAEERWFLITVTPLADDRSNGAVVMHLDITERRNAENRIRRLNRVYAVLSGINTLIVRVHDREELFREACRVAHEEGGFRMAWIGALDRTTMRIAPLAFAGMDEAALSAVKQRFSVALTEDTALGQSLAALAIGCKQPTVSNDIMQDPRVVFAGKHFEAGVRSIAMLPLIVGKEPVGLLALYAGELDFFHVEEMKLLSELAGDIAFALDNIDKAGRLARITRVNAILSGINGAIVHIHDRGQLFREACRIAVETGALPFAWAGELEASGKHLKLVASAGRDDGFLQTIHDRLALRDSAPEEEALSARAIREQRAIVVNDVASDPVLGRRKAFADRGIRSVAVFPLFVAGRGAGVFALHSEQPGFFDNDEMRLLDEVAANIAFALEHIQKEEKVKQLTRTYAVLSGVNSAIVRMVERNALFEEVCRIAVADGGFIAVRVVELDSNGTARIAASNEYGLPLFQKIVEEYNGDPAGSQNLLAHALRSGQPTISNDVASDIRMPNRVALTMDGSFSVVLLPIVVGQRVAGMVVLRGREAGMFDDTELRLLVEVVSNLSFAIDHIEKAEKLDRLTRVNAVLSGINGAIVHIRDRRQLFQEVCRIAVETGGLPFCWLCMLDATGSRLEPVGYAGPNDGFLEMIADRLSLRDDADGYGISARSVREKRAIRISDVAASDRVKHKAALADRGIKSSAAFPLIIAGRAIGSFALNASEVDFFDDEEMRLLNEVAGNIAFALEHIEKQEKLLRLTRVYAVSSRITSLIVHVDDREQLFREACRIAVEDGKFAMAWIGDLDAATQDVTPVAWAGEAAEELTRAKSSARDDTPRGMGAVGQSIRARRPIFNNNILTQGFGGPRIKEIMRLGFQSHITLPLYENQAIVATLTLYTKEQGYFDEDEVRLLTELAEDISFALENIGRQTQLDYLAYYDELTGLANRSLFLERLGQHMRTAVSNGHRLALFFLDLERFRNINDSLGRSAGDALLKQVSEWLSRSVGDPSLLARLGADHFAVVLPEVKQEGDVARLLDKRIREFVEHPFHVNHTEIRIAIKVGISLFPNNGVDADTLLRNAEAALKQAKERGDRYLYYTRTMNEAVAGNLTLENQLRQALENEEFVLHFQPKVSLGTGKLAGAEALIRWNDPRTGLVPPGRFIPILEETGLIHDVGRWALRKAIEQSLHWRAAGLPAMRVAVNVSPLQLRSPGFIAEVQQAISIDAHAADGLELEITESVIMEDIKNSIASLQAIRAMGITVAIDDFGTGFSSLSYLAKLPVDTLKIDRSFVTDMTSGPDGMALVSMIINLAHSLKLTVVAEGVETEEQSRLLRLLHCDQMQGYLFSKPVPAADFEARFLAAPALA